MPSMAARGRQLFANKGCAGCHTPGASVHAPLLGGLFGSRVPLQDGSFVKADEQYIHDSILLPLKQVAAGYKPVMPSYQGQLEETEVLALVEYLKTLRPARDDATTRARRRAPHPEMMRKGDPGTMSESYLTSRRKCLPFLVPDQGPQADRDPLSRLDHRLLRASAESPPR